MRFTALDVATMMKITKSTYATGEKSTCQVFTKGICVQVAGTSVKGTSTSAVPSSSPMET